MGSGPYTAPGSRRTDAGAAFALPRSRRHRTSPMRVFSTMPWAPWPVFAFPFPARAPHPVPVATTNFAVDEFSEVRTELREVASCLVVERVRTRWTGVGWKGAR
jgi:hypothetical protein